MMSGGPRQSLLAGVRDAVEDLQRIATETQGNLETVVSFASRRISTEESSAETIENAESRAKPCIGAGLTMPSGPFQKPIRLS